MGTARVFRSGNSRSDEIALREKEGIVALAFDLMVAMPEDAKPALRRDDPPQKRKGL